MSQQRKRRVFTTINPRESIQVTESEYTDLSRQGLIVREDVGDAPALPRVAAAPAPAPSAPRKATKTSSAPAADTTSTKEG